MYFDTHVHWDEFEAEELTDEVVGRARSAGVSQMLAVGGSPEANRLAVALAARYPEVIFAAVGADRDQAERAIAEYIRYYNEERLNSAIGYIAPADKLAGREKLIFAERDRKLEEARKRPRSLLLIEDWRAGD